MSCQVIKAVNSPTKLKPTDQNNQLGKILSIEGNCVLEIQQLSNWSPLSLQLKGIHSKYCKLIQLPWVNEILDLEETTSVTSPKQYNLWILSIINTYNYTIKCSSVPSSNRLIFTTDRDHLRKTKQVKANIYIHPSWYSYTITITTNHSLWHSTYRKGNDHILISRGPECHLEDTVFYIWQKSFTYEKRNVKKRQKNPKDTIY